jgi:hypothetical protein
LRRLAQTIRYERYKTDISSTNTKERRRLGQKSEKFAIHIFKKKKKERNKEITFSKVEYLRGVHQEDSSDTTSIDYQDPL